MLKIFLKMSALCLPFVLVAADTIVGRADEGQKKSQVCSACHQADGNSVVPQWPKLAGQHEEYLKAQLHEFRKGENGLRYNPQMYPFAMGLSDQDIADLAAYFSSQKVAPHEADNQPDLKLGEQIYRGGIASKQIAACSSCHGPNGSGNGPAKIPSLSLQHKEYTITALKEYRDGTRKNYIMSVVAKNLSDEEINAVSNYLQGLS